MSEVAVLDHERPLPEDRPRAPTVRSRLMLEVASELVGATDWPHKQASIRLRTQGPHPWAVELAASDGPDAVAGVLEGTTTFAILNPAVALRPAVRRLGASADAVAAIATIPSFDQMGFAVAAAVGASSLANLRELQPPLRLSLRSQRNHAVHLVVEDVLSAVGLTLEDLVAWGGTVRYDEGLPHRGDRAQAIASGGVDAVFDEGIYNWTSHAAAAGLRFLDVEDDALRRLQAKGYRRARLTRQRFPALDRDVETLDFSGFLIYTRRDTADEIVTAFCAAVDRRRDRIPWQGGPTLPLERMVNDAPDAPLPVPLHPAADAYWRSRGYRSSSGDSAPF